MFLIKKRKECEKKIRIKNFKKKNKNKNKKKERKKDRRTVHHHLIQSLFHQESLHYR